MVSVKDVAAHAGVSTGTVSKFLNTPERVAHETSRRIAKAIRELGYVPNQAARQLRNGRSRTLALLTIELGNPFFGEVAESIERRAAALDLYLTIASTHGDSGRESAYIEQFVQQRVYGVLLATGATQRTDLLRLREVGIPAVLIDSADHEGVGVSSTAVDDVFGGELAAAHLLDTGCRSLLFVGGPLQVHQVKDRLEGVRNAADRRGVTVSAIETAERSVSAGRAVGKLIATQSTAVRPDGVLAANDLLAIGVLQELIESGVRVPEDIAIVGYDDIEFAASSTVPLTTVHRPRHVFGRTAVDLIVDEATSKSEMSAQHIMIRPELVVRRSTRRE